MDAARPIARSVPDGHRPLSQFEQIRYAREILRVEADALVALASRLDAEFCRAVDLLYACRGSVLVSGMGKAGLIGQKIAATLASTGTRSHFLHPAEAFHGDLGRIHRDDVVLLLSQSGETEEVTRLLPSLVELNIPLIAVTASCHCTLGQSATVTLPLGPLQEACSLGLAPSTSTTAMLGVGDALALVASRMRRFSAEDFARFHPGGSLGRRLSTVDQQMRALAECRIAHQLQSVREVLVAGRRPGRRTGAIMLVDDDGRLTGLFTDSDLARLFEIRRDSALDQPIRDVMTARPMSVVAGSLVQDAVALLAEHKISELPVVDACGRPAGLLDVTDLVNRNFISPDGEADVVEFKPSSNSA